MEINIIIRFNVFLPHIYENILRNSQFQVNHKPQLLYVMTIITARILKAAFLYRRPCSVSQGEAGKRSLSQLQIHQQILWGNLRLWC